ncbi:hypothetical protein Tco_1013060, partial [Tanacetum coccineum]
LDLEDSEMEVTRMVDEEAKDGYPSDKKKSFEKLGCKVADMVEIEASLSVDHIGGSACFTSTNWSMSPSTRMMKQGKTFRVILEPLQKHGSQKPKRAALGLCSPPSYQCRNWHARMWYEERTNKVKRVVNPTFFLCCQDGKVLLSKFNDTPPPLNTLLDYNDPATSRNQMAAFVEKETGDKVDKRVVTSLSHKLDSNVESRTKTRQYNTPTVSKVAALITNDFGDEILTRDIIVNKKDTGPNPRLDDDFHNAVNG